MANADYNPDKEAHVAHKWEVIKATKRPVNVEVDGQEMHFGKDGAFRVSDAGVANEIRQRYARTGDVTVTRLRYPGAADQGHRYFFGRWPEMPWKRSNGNGKDADEKENAP